MTNQNPFEEVRQIAEGKIKCTCGNEDWKMFLYVGTMPTIFAACKTCGGVWEYSPSRPAMKLPSMWVKKF